MGRRRQTKEQFIKSRQDARATEAKAAEAKRIQDQALARRNANRTRLDLYRNKFRQPVQPGGTSNPTAEMQQQPAQPGMASNPIGSLASNAIGSTVGNQVVGGSDKTMVQPGLQDGGFALPQSQFDFNNNSIVTPKQGQDVYGRQSNTMASDLNNNVSDDMSTGSNALQPDTFSNITRQDIDTVKQDDLKPNQDSNINVNAAVGALKTLANAIEPKEELPATQYKSFNVDDNSAPIKDTMSARREALMNLMSRR
jgi:hypothetical protein